MIFFPTSLCPPPSTSSSWPSFCSWMISVSSHTPPKSSSDSSSTPKTGASEIDTSYQFPTSPAQNHSRSHLAWRVMTYFPTPTYNTFNEVRFFCDIVVMLDPTLSFHDHCIMLISRIWKGHASLRDKLQSVRTPSATLLFRRWQGRVAVHLPSHLALLSQPAQTTRLQSALDLSLSPSESPPSPSPS